MARERPSMDVLETYDGMERVPQRGDQVHVLRWARSNGRTIKAPSTVTYYVVRPCDEGDLGWIASTAGWRNETINPLDYTIVLNTAAKGVIERTRNLLRRTDLERVVVDPSWYPSYSEAAAEFRDKFGWDLDTGKKTKR